MFIQANLIVFALLALSVCLGENYTVCEHKCLNRGICNQQTDQCSCFKGWSGSQCQDLQTIPTEEIRMYTSSGKEYFDEQGFGEDKPNILTLPSRVFQSPVELYHEVKDGNKLVLYGCGSGDEWIMLNKDRTLETSSGIIYDYVVNVECSKNKDMDKNYFIGFRQGNDSLFSNLPKEMNQHYNISGVSISTMKFFTFVSVQAKERSYFYRFNETGLDSDVILDSVVFEDTIYSHVYNDKIFLVLEDYQFLLCNFSKICEDPKTLIPLVANETRVIRVKDNFVYIDGSIVYYIDKGNFVRVSNVNLLKNIKFTHEPFFRDRNNQWWIVEKGKFLKITSYIPGISSFWKDKYTVFIDPKKTECFRNEIDCSGSSCRCIAPVSKTVCPQGSVNKDTSNEQGCKACDKPKNCMGGQFCTAGFEFESRYPCYYCKSGYFRFGKACRKCNSQPAGLIIVLSVLTVLAVIVSALMVVGQSVMAKLSIIVSFLQFSFLAFFQIPISIDPNVVQFVKDVFEFVPTEIATQLTSPRCLLPKFHHGFLVRWGLILYGSLFLLIFGVLVTLSLSCLKFCNRRCRSGFSVHLDHLLWTANVQIKRLIFLYILTTYTGAVRTIIKGFDRREYGLVASQNDTQYSWGVVVLVFTLIGYLVFPLVMLGILIYTKFQERKITKLRKLSNEMAKLMSEGGQSDDADFHKKLNDYHKRLKNQSRIYETLQAFQTVREPFKSNFWYFYVVELIRKLIFSIFTTIPTNRAGAIAVTVLLLICSVVYFVIIFFLQPYEVDYANIGRFTIKNMLNRVALVEAGAQVIQLTARIFLFTSFSENVNTIILGVLFGLNMLAFVVMIIAQLIGPFFNGLKFIVFRNKRRKRGAKYKHLSQDVKLFMLAKTSKEKMIKYARKGKFSRALVEKRSLDLMRRQHTARLHNKKSFYANSGDKEYSKLVTILHILAPPSKMNITHTKKQFEKIKQEAKQDISTLEFEISKLSPPEMIENDSIVHELYVCKTQVHDFLRQVELDILRSESFETKKALKFCKLLKKEQSKLNYSFYQKNVTDSFWEKYIVPNYYNREKSLSLIRAERSGTVPMNEINDAYESLKSFADSNVYTHIQDRLHALIAVRPEGYKDIVAKDMKIYHAIQAAGKVQKGDNPGNIVVVPWSEVEKKLKFFYKQWIVFQESRQWELGKKFVAKCKNELFQSAQSHYRCEMEEFSKGHYQRAERHFNNYKVFYNGLLQWTRERENR